MPPAVEEIKTPGTLLEAASPVKIISSENLKQLLNIRESL
jgi:hypothetical protein